MSRRVTFSRASGALPSRNRVVVLGYVVMRVAMLTQWLRAARQCPSRRGTCIAYAVSIALAQLGWVVTAIVDTSLITFALIAGVLIAVECVGPYLAERHGGPSAAVCTSQPVAETGHRGRAGV